MRSIHGLAKRKGQIAVVGAIAVLIGYIGFLLGTNYHSQVELQESSLAQFRWDSEKRATTLSYFYSERKNDLNSLAVARALSTFFENKALGMSMEYGLRASLLGITEVFENLLEKKLGDNRIYERISFVNRDGRLLVDCQALPRKGAPERNWKKFTSQQGSAKPFTVFRDGEGVKELISIPYFFKNVYAGQIIGWISSRAVYENFLVPRNKMSKHFLYFTSENEAVPLRDDSGTAFPVPADLVKVENGKTHRFQEIDKYGEKVDMVAVRVPVKDSPFFLVSSVPVAEVLGHTGPKRLLLAMGFLAIVVLGGAAVLLRSNMQNLILNARLEESSKKEQQVQEMNGQLVNEIVERKRAEDALREARDQLEKRVEERTEELVTTNKHLECEIGERRRTEDVLRLSEARLLTVIESLPFDFFIIDENNQYIMQNTVCKERWGDVTGKRPEDMSVDEDTLNLWLNNNRRAFAGEIVKGEVELNVQGERGFYHNIIAPISDGSQLRGILGVNIDISDLKRAEEALIQSEHRYRSLVENTPEGCFILEFPSGKFLFLNQSICDMFGYTVEEGLTRTVWDVIASEEHELLKRRAEALLNKERLNPERHIYQGLRKDGSSLRAEVSGSAIIFQGKPVLQGVLRDVTEQERLQRQLQHALKMEAVGTLAGGISHDFNNLLQAILGYAELLLMGKNNEKSGHRELEEILHAARRGRELTQQLLTFSRKVESKRRPIDLNRSVRQGRRLLARTIPKMIEIELHLADDLKIINADPVQVEQVLMNLAVNAKDAMPNGGKLIIATQNTELDEEYCKFHAGARPGEYGLLSVSDTGHGMDKQTLEHIFEPFYTTKQTGQGTGLGLATVYGIVKDHEGYIMCYSEPHKGTTFKLYLPVIQKAHDLQMQELRETEVQLKGGNETILLVDDERFIREFGADMLARYGYTVFTAGSGEEALELYEQRRETVDLVILDLIMPGMGGKRFLESLLQLDPEARVLIASGYMADEAIRKTIERGSKGFVRKPFHISEILEATRQALM
jgi:PAS domain S-box-containing protein